MKVKELKEILDNASNELEVVVLYDAWWHPIVETKPIVLYTDDGGSNCL